MDNNFQKLSKLPPYIFTVTDRLKAQALASGHDVIDFAMGNPDLPPPKAVIDTLIEVSKTKGAHRYTSSQGLPPLRKAIAHWYERLYNVSLDSDKEVIVTLGSKEGISHLTMAMINAGDHVIVPEPCYPIHRYGFVLAGAEINEIPLTPLETFTERLKQKISLLKNKPKALIINFPSNPTALCVTLEFFEEIVAIARHYQMWVIHDFAYADLVFDGYRAPSILQVPYAKEVAVETYSLSKSFNMPGWRVGFVCGNANLIQALAKIKSYYDYGLFLPIQAAAEFALNYSETLIEPIRATYQKRRDILCQGLKNMGWEVPVPLATMFVWAQLPAKFQSLKSLGFVEKLLTSMHLSLSPGIAFGQAADNYVRFSLIEPVDRIEKAISRIKSFLQN